MNCPFGGHIWCRDRRCTICGMTMRLYLLTNRGTEPELYRAHIESRPEAYPEVPMQYDTIRGWRIAR